MSNSASPKDRFVEEYRRLYTAVYEPGFDHEVPKYVGARLLRDASRLIGLLREENRKLRHRQTFVDLAELLDQVNWSDECPSCGYIQRSYKTKEQTK